MAQHRAFSVVEPTPQGITFLLIFMFSEWNEWMNYNINNSERKRNCSIDVHHAHDHPIELCFCVPTWTLNAGCEVFLDVKYFFKCYCRFVNCLLTTFNLRGVNQWDFLFDQSLFAYAMVGHWMAESSTALHITSYNLCHCRPGQYLFTFLILYKSLRLHFSCISM